MKALLKEKLSLAMNYEEYREFFDCLVQTRQTSGSNQSEDMINYTKLNLQRVKRVEKSGHLISELKVVLDKLKKPMIWLIITEAWCGDAAQNLPYLHLIAAQSDLIDCRLILRDENLDIMDQFLTNGGRSIPKLIAFNPDNFDILFLWGPRPKLAQDAVSAWKAAGIDHDEFILKLHTWYAQNKGDELQKELLELLKNL